MTDLRLGRRHTMRLRARVAVISVTLMAGFLSLSAATGLGVTAAGAATANVYQTGLAGATRMKATPSGQGFFVLSPNGSVRGYGDATALGDAHLPHPAVAIAVTRSGHGYWVFDANGCAAAFGDATPFAQSVCGEHLNGPVLDAATTPSGKGYWLVANDGGLFTFGDAVFAGSMGGKRLNAPVVGMAPAASGGGYWEVAADGGVFNFATPFLGSTGATPLNKPVVGMVASGGGYMMVGTDGGIFNFGNPYFGSLGDNPPPSPVVATAPSFDSSGRANGYWMLDGSGAVYGFGAAWLPAGAVPVGTPPPPPPSGGGSGLCGAPANPYGFNYCGRGGLIYSPPTDICNYFACIGNFWNGTGYMVECADGMVSMSGGRQGACSYHEGELQPVYSGP